MIKILSLGLTVGAMISCVQTGQKSDVKKYFVGECENDKNDKCIYTQSKTFSKNVNTRVSNKNGVSISSFKRYVTVVDMFHIGPERYYEGVADAIFKNVKKTKLTVRQRGKVVRGNHTMPPVQILEGIGCDSDFYIVDYNKLQFPETALKQIASDADYDVYFEALLAANKLNSSSDISDFLIRKIVKRTSNSLINLWFQS